MRNSCVVKKENLVRVSEPEVNYEASFNKLEKVIDLLVVNYGENAKITLHNVKLMMEEAIVVK